MSCEFCLPEYGDAFINRPVNEAFTCPYCHESHQPVSTTDQLTEATRSRVVTILAASLTPATLAAAIFDLDSYDQPDDRDWPIAERVKQSFLRQLQCMVGAADARRMIEAQAGPKAEPSTTEIQAGYEDSDGYVCPNCRAVNEVHDGGPRDGRPIAQGDDCACGCCAQSFVAEVHHEPAVPTR